jgi:hypothetical protein
MADETHQAHVRGTPPGLDTETDEHGLTILEVSEGDNPPAEPYHTIADELGTFDPNAALRNKRGQGPGLQDSEALRPAVWTDHDDEKARVTAAEADVKAAQAQLDQAKARLKDAKKS